MVGRIGVLAILAALGGCSGTEGGKGNASAGSGGASGSAGSAGSGATASGGAGGSSAGSSSGGTESAGSGGSAGAGDTQHHGQVLLYRIAGLQANNQYGMNVFFISSSSGGSGRTCTSTTDGPCSVNVCDPAAPGTPTGMTSYASAGNVTITSPQLMGSAVATPDVAGNYTPTIDFSTALSGQEHLQISAAGDEVPAFQGELDVPLTLLLSAPVFEKEQAFEAPLGADLVLTWTRGVKDVSLYVQGYSVDANQAPTNASLVCTFPSEAGTGTIAKALLEKLGVDGRLNLYTSTTKTVTAGDYQVLLGTVMTVANPNKDFVRQLALK